MVYVVMNKLVKYFIFWSHNFLVDSTKWGCWVKDKCKGKLCQILSSPSPQSCIIVWPSSTARGLLFLHSCPHRQNCHTFGFCQCYRKVVTSRRSCSYRQGGKPLLRVLCANRECCQTYGYFQSKALNQTHHVTCQFEKSNLFLGLKIW